MTLNQKPSLTRCWASHTSPPQYPMTMIHSLTLIHCGRHEHTKYIIQWTPYGGNKLHVRYNKAEVLCNVKTEQLSVYNLLTCAAVTHIWRCKYW